MASALQSFQNGTVRKPTGLQGRLRREKQQTLYRGVWTANAPGQTRARHSTVSGGSAPEREFSSLHCPSEQRARDNAGSGNPPSRQILWQPRWLNEKLSLLLTSEMTKARQYFCPCPRRGGHGHCLSRPLPPLLHGIFILTNLVSLKAIY